MAIDMARRVLFHYSILNSGGAEKSSIRMIKALADRGWDVTLVLTTGGGALESEIDPRVKVVRLRPRACGNRFVVARSWSAKIRAIPDLVCYGIMRIIALYRILPFYWRNYDAAVVLSISLDPNFVARVVRCDARLHWIRNDFDGQFPARERAVRAIRANHKLFDYYVCVSEVTRQSLVRAIPEVASKSTVVYNILDSDTMKSQGLEEGQSLGSFGPSTLKVLTVCRLKDKAKGLLRMVRVCRQLVDDGLDFVWFVIGDGPDREAVSTAIAEAELGDRMILLGFVSNPFPAYRDADLVAMLSNYEGLSGVINEAKIMGCPIIATRVSGVEEQLTDRVNGFIVDNDEQSIYEEMKFLLSSRSVIEQTRNFKYPSDILDDEKKLKKIEQLLLNEVSS